MKRCWAKEHKVRVDFDWTIPFQLPALHTHEHSRSAAADLIMAECERVDRSNQGMDKSITLPPDEIFRNLENAKRFAIDIGMYLQLCFQLLAYSFWWNVASYCS